MCRLVPLITTLYLKGTLNSKIARNYYPSGNSIEMLLGRPQTRAVLDIQL